MVVNQSVIKNVSKPEQNPTVMKLQIFRIKKYLKQVLIILV